MKKLLVSSACIAILACAAMTACGAFRNTKSAHEIAVEQCTYGANVPNNVDWKHRQAYIKNVAVPACMKAKGWSDAEAQP